MKMLKMLLIFHSVIFLSMMGCGEVKKEQTPVDKNAAVSKQESKKMPPAGIARNEASAARKVQAGNQTVELTNKSAQKSSMTETAAEKSVSVYEKTKGMDWSMTPERRKEIENAIEDSVGFIDGNILVQEIITNNITDRAERIKIFSEKANGKYIYFAAQTNPNPFNSNASLNLIFGEGAMGPDFLMVQLVAPKEYNHKKYLEIFGGTGYVTAFLGKLKADTDLVLEPCYDLYLTGYFNK